MSTEVGTVTEGMPKGASEPLRLLALDADDLQIMSAALQDAIVPPADIIWDQRTRTA